MNELYKRYSVSHRRLTVDRANKNAVNQAGTHDVPDEDTRYDIGVCSRRARPYLTRYNLTERFRHQGVHYRYIQESLLSRTITQVNDT